MAGTGNDSGSVDALVSVSDPAPAAGSLAAAMRAEIDRERGGAGTGSAAAVDAAAAGEGAPAPTGANVTPAAPVPRTPASAPGSASDFTYGELGAAMLKAGFPVEGMSDAEISELIEGGQGAQASSSIQSPASAGQAVSGAAGAAGAAGAQSPAIDQDLIQKMIQDAIRDAGRTGTGTGIGVGSGVGVGVGGGTGSPGAASGNGDSTGRLVTQTPDGSIDASGSPSATTGADAKAKAGDSAKAAFERKYQVPAVDERANQLLQVGLIKRDDKSGLYTGDASVQSYVNQLNDHQSFAQRFGNELLRDPYSVIGELAGEQFRKMEQQLAEVKSSVEATVEARLKAEREKAEAEYAEASTFAEVEQFVLRDHKAEFFVLDDAGNVKHEAVDQGGKTVNVPVMTDKGKTYEETWVELEAAGVKDVKVLHRLSLKAAGGVSGAPAPASAPAAAAKVDTSGDSRRRTLLRRMSEEGGGANPGVVDPPASGVPASNGVSNTHRPPSLLELVEKNRR